VPDIAFSRYCRGRLARAILSTVLLLLTAAAVNAEDLLPKPTFPSYHRVVGVAGNDVLNIRLEPSARSPIVGSFAPNASNIEVIDISNGWGRVIVAESNGWVRMKFLAETAIATIAGTRIPEAIQCFGTEPFWDLVSLGGDRMVFNDINAQKTEFTISNANPASSRETIDVVWMRSVNATGAVFFDRQYCSDGMSDRLYGRRVLFSITANGEALGFDGCCMLKSPAR